MNWWQKFKRRGLARREKHRLLGIWYFCLIWAFLPSVIVFWKPLTFLLTFVFWLLVGFLLSTISFSIYHNHIEDKDDEHL